MSCVLVSSLVVCCSAFANLGRAATAGPAAKADVELGLVLEVGGRGSTTACASLYLYPYPYLYHYHYHYHYHCLYLCLSLPPLSLLSSSSSCPPPPPITIVPTLLYPLPTYPAPCRAAHTYHIPHPLITPPPCAPR